MRKRLQHKPDNRPHWSDPNLPVFGKSGRAIDHRKAELVAQMRMADSDDPTFRRDPTYNLKRKPKDPA